MKPRRRPKQYNTKQYLPVPRQPRAVPPLGWLYGVEIGIQVLWGLTPSASHFILTAWPIEAYAALRFTFSSLIFFVAALLIQPSLRLRRRDLTAMVFLGFLTYGAASLGLLTALQRGGVITFALASSANALITALASVIVLSERWHRGLTQAIGLSVAGSLLLAWGKFGISTAEIAFGSVGLVWLAYLGESLGLVFSRRYQQRYSLALYCAILQGSGAAFLWIAAAATHRLPPSFAAPPAVWATLAFVVLVPCCLCYGVHYWLVRFIDGHRLGFFDCVHTLAAALFGYLLFGERFDAAMVAGGVLLIAAVWTVNRRRPVPPSPSTGS
jgi:drug/metabolite transporter (DMT)-like permease